MPIDNNDPVQMERDRILGDYYASLSQAMNKATAERDQASDAGLYGLAAQHAATLTALGEAREALVRALRPGWQPPPV